MMHGHMNLKFVSIILLERARQDIVVTIPITEASECTVHCSYKLPNSQLSKKIYIYIYISYPSTGLDKALRFPGG
jgi:hypothetical protein